jgi:hypothetical protein
VRTCVHLEPLENELAKQGVELGDGGRSPYSDSGVWFPVNCTFDGPAVRARLALPDFITYEEYDGRVAGSDATWYCWKCSRAVMGMHPRYAKATTPRIS